MRKKGHLTLISSSVKPESISMLETSFSNTTSSKAIASIKSGAAANTIAHRLGAAESELSLMHNVLSTVFLLIQSMPIQNLSLKDLDELHDTLSSGKRLLDAYQMELTSLGNSRISTQGARRLARVKNLFKQLNTTVPQTIAHVEVVMKASSAKLKSVKPAKTKSPKGAAQLNGVQLKITLKGSNPPIWRRLIVPGDCTLGELHYTIQRAMGWEDNHLHCFKIGDEVYSDAEDDLNEDQYSLRDFTLEKGSKFEYVYDFGDDWVHSIEFEQTMEQPHQVLECIDGRMACPPEDCGGIVGYYHMLDVLKNPLHPYYNDVKRFVGEDFDPEGM